MKDLELIPAQSQPLAVIETPKTPMELLTFAVSHGAAPEALSQLLDLHERVEKREAEKAYNVAMAAFQAETPVLLRTVMGPDGKFKFTPLDHIVQLIRPCLNKHGLSFAFSEVTPVNAGGKRVSCVIKHVLGHRGEPSFAEFRIDERNKLASAPQQDAGALSYGERRSLLAALGIQTAKDDVAGQQAAFKVTLGSLTAERKQAAASPQPAQSFNPPTDSPDTRQAARAMLWTTLKNVRGTEQSWHAAQRYLTDELGIETLVDKMSLAELQEATRKAKSKLTP